MDPWFARNRLSAYLDDALAPAERAELEAQLAVDAELRRELDGLRAAIGIVREHGRLAAPQGFHERVMARVDLERPPAANRPMQGSRWRVYAAVGVAAAVLLGVPAVWWATPRQAPSEMVAAAGPAPMAEETIPDEVPPPAKPAPTELAEQAREAARELRANGPDGAVADTRRSDGSSSGHARVSGLPGSGTYNVPAWDREPEAQELIGGTTGSSVQAAGVHRRPTADFRITLAEADTLLRLDDIARTAGGELLDKRGLPFQARVMDEDLNFASPQLIVPGAMADQVRAQLLAMGALESRALGEHADTDTVAFRVNVTYNP